MSNVWGENIQVTTFGESHGEAIGVVINGIKAGTEIDFKWIDKAMNLRRPGRNRLVTPRNEKDLYEILSGVLDGKATGTPITAIIRNTNTRSKDYSILKTTMRPSHSDYGAFVKYKGHNNHSGGGQFSGRLTAPLTFAGALCKSILQSKGIEIRAYLKTFHKHESTNNAVFEDDGFYDRTIQTSDGEFKEKVFEEIEALKQQLDSTGGTVEVIVRGIPAGIGEAYFGSLESQISQMMFTIPGVKGIEFGDGFDIAHQLGSEVADEMYYVGDEVKFYANHNGGILGGLSNGNEIVIRIAFKPTSSIGSPLRTIDVHEKSNVELRTEGRHDPAFVIRAPIVVESALSIVLLDQIGC